MACETVALLARGVWVNNSKAWGGTKRRCIKTLVIPAQAGIQTGNALP